MQTTVITQQVSELPATCMGQLLLYGGFIDEKLLREALHDQQQYPRQLGEILESSQYISPSEKQALLHLQAHLRDLPLSMKSNGCLPESLQLSLGQLLLENGEIIREQLDQALREHEQRGQHLGEILVENHALSPARLGNWLSLQKKLITAAAAACLLMGFSGTAAAGDKGHRHFWEHFQFSKQASNDDQLDQSPWTRRRASALSGLDTVQRAFGELVRSRDGSTVVSVSQNGLEITKRF